jgi:transposase
MIPRGVEVYLGLDAVDMRWGVNRLSGAVREKFGRESRCRALFVFYGKRRDTLKVLFYDGSGMCVFYKRLDKGQFRIPQPFERESVVELSESALEDLLDGIDVEMKPESVSRNVH